MTDRTFYVRFPVPGADAYDNCNSGTKITIPEDLDYEDARTYLIERITRHVEDYGADRILRALGMPEIRKDGVQRFRFDSCRRFHWLVENGLPGEAEALITESDRLWAEENAATLRIEEDKQ